MNAWSQLPNAAHIDRVSESLKAHRNIWTADFDAAWDAASNAAWDAAWEKALAAARVSILHAILHGEPHWDVKPCAAWDAVAALIAWDDSARFLDMTGDELEVWAALSEDPQAILLLPAVRAFDRIKELESV